jgi:hypothetical protein
MNFRTLGKNLLFLSLQNNKLDPVPYSIQKRLITQEKQRMGLVCTTIFILEEMLI